MSESHETPPETPEDAPPNGPTQQEAPVEPTRSDDASPPPPAASEALSPDPKENVKPVSGQGAASLDVGSVIWVATWTALLSLGIAVGASTWERVESNAGARSLLLLPATESGENERNRWLEALTEAEAIESGEWLSPKSLVQQVSATVPPDMWAQLFDESDAWIPWLLQLQPTNPLHDIEAFRVRLAEFRDDPRFRLVLYDEAALERDLALYRDVRRGTFIGAGVLFFLGALALAFSPAPAQWKFDPPLGAALSIILIGVGWYGLAQAGVTIPQGQALRAFGTALGLAVLIAPMLKGRIARHPKKARRVIL